MVKNILILGGSGNCGSHLNKYFIKNYKVTSTYFANINYKKEKNYHKINLNNFKDLEKLINTINPDIIIHASALTDVRLCEKNFKKCNLVNFQQTQNIVNICKKQDLKLVYISTDAVYKGKKYYLHRESDNLSYVNNYQKCKIKSENFIKNNLKKYMILRTNPFGLNKHKNSIYWLFKTFKSKKKINGFIDYEYNPIFSLDLAKILEKLIKLNFNGIINIGSLNIINKYEFARLIVKQFKLKTIVQKKSIYSIYSKKNVKLNSSMNLDKLKKLIQIKNIPTIKQTIRNFYEFEKKIKY